MQQLDTVGKFLQKSLYYGQSSNCNPLGMAESQHIQCRFTAQPRFMIVFPGPHQILTMLVLCSFTAMKYNCFVNVDLYHFQFYSLQWIGILLIGQRWSQSAQQYHNNKSFPFSWFFFQFVLKSEGSVFLKWGWLLSGGFLQLMSMGRTLHPLSHCISAP